MRRTFNITNNNSGYLLNMHKFVDEEAEQIIGETRKTLKSFLNNLRGKESSIQLYWPIFTKQNNQSSSLSVTKKHLISTPIISRPMETCSNEINVIHKKGQYISPNIHINKAKPNLSSSNLNKKRTINYFPSPITPVQSKQPSQSKLFSNTNSYNNSSNNNNSKTKPFISRNYKSQLFYIIQKNLKKIKEDNIENKKAIINLVNLNKSFSEEILNKINEYYQKNQVLLTQNNETQNKEKNLLKELQKYKRCFVNLRQTKENLLREKASLFKEKDKQINEIIILKKEIKNMRSENGNKNSQILKLKNENEDFRKRNIKLIEENTHLQIELKDIENNKETFNIQNNLLKSNLLLLQTNNSFTYNAKPKKIQKIQIVKNQFVSFIPYIKRKTIGILKVSNPLIQTIICKKQNAFLNKKLVISYKNNEINYHPNLLLSKKQTLSIIYNSELCLYSNPVQNPFEKSEKQELLNKLEEITRQNDLLNKDNENYQQQIRETKESLFNKEHEINTQNMELLKIIEENDQMATELDEKNKDINLKNEEIKNLKNDLQNITNQFNELKQVNKSTNDSLQNNQEKLINNLKELIKENEGIIKENNQLQKIIQGNNEEIQRNREQIKTLSLEKVQYEIKESDVYNKINSLYEEKQLLKDKLQDSIQKENSFNTKIQQLINKGYDEGDSIESLKEKMTMLRMQLIQNNENVNKAKEISFKAKSFDECSKYIDILLKDFQPQNENHNMAINYLKTEFNLNNDNPDWKKEQFYEDHLILSDSLRDTSNKNEQFHEGRGSTLKQKRYLQTILNNINNKDLFD